MVKYEIDLEELANKGNYESFDDESSEQLKKAINFKSKAGYKKWLAYGHMHIPDFGKGKQKIKIAGKAHKVKHTK